MKHLAVVIASMILWFGLIGAVAMPTSAAAERASVSSAAALIAPVAAAEADVAGIEVKVGEKESRAWYQNPIWIIVMILVGGVVVALIVSAGRRG
jgi:hypothetical protein